MNFKISKTEKQAILEMYQNKKNINELIGIKPGPESSTEDSFQEYLEIGSTVANQINGFFPLWDVTKNNQFIGRIQMTFGIFTFVNKDFEPRNSKNDKRIKMASLEKLVKYIDENYN